MARRAVGDAGGGTSGAVATPARGSVAARPRLVKADSLRQQIYRDLRGRLQRCEIGANDRLVDLEVAAAYGTSRMPAREALLQLVHEGYLAGSTRGFVIPTLSEDDVREIFEIRRLLEPRAAGNAARDLTPPADHALALALAEAEASTASGDVERLILANIAFRSAWLAAVRNRRLAATIARFVDHVQTVRLHTLRDGATQRVVLDGLIGLYDAFRARDALAAQDRMAAFVASAERAYFHAADAAAADAPAGGAPAPVAAGGPTAAQVVKGGRR